MRKTIRLYWWAPYRDPYTAAAIAAHDRRSWLGLAGRHLGLPRNVGDELSPHIVRAVTGRRVDWAPPKRATLVAVGSVLEEYTRRGRGAAVWGTGLRCGDTSESVASLVAESVGPVLAVRGPVTAQMLGQDRAGAQGDPGLLSGLLVPSGGRKRSSRLLYMPHFSDFGTALGRSRIDEARTHGWEILPPNTEPIEALTRIYRGAGLVTSALHGVVLAHALATPVVLVGTSSQAREPRFKYEDYFQSIGMPCEFREFSHVVRSGPRRNRILERAGIALESSTQFIEIRVAELLEAAKGID